MKKSIALLAVLLAAPFAHADTLKPGLWEFSSQTKGAGMPDMPTISDAQRKQMEAMGIKLPQTKDGGIATANRICITPEQAKKGIPPSMDKDGEKCETSDVKTSGKTTTWKMACTGKHKMTGQGSSAQHSDEHMSGETTMNMQSGPQGGMTMNSKFDAKFIGADCKATK